MKLTGILAFVAPAICPKPPPGVEPHANAITSYVMWGVIYLFLIGLLMGVGALVAGRILSLPHASKMGVVSIVVVLVAAIAYMVLPGILKGFTGNGCVAASDHSHSVIVAARQPS